MEIEASYKFVPEGLSLEAHFSQRQAKARKILKLLDRYTDGLKNKSLLDVGCHEGTITRYLAPSFASTTGLDSDSAIIEIAQQLDDQNISFVTYDGKYFPFDDDCFDVLLANHVIYYVEDPHQFSREVKRVLKPGGVCYLSAINISYVRKPVLVPEIIWSIIRRNLLKAADNYGTPISYDQYVEFFNKFQVVDISLDLLNNSREFTADIEGWQKIIILTLGKLPVNFLNLINKLLPTYIYLLINSEIAVSKK